MPAFIVLLLLVAVAVLVVRHRSANRDGQLLFKPLNPPALPTEQVFKPSPLKRSRGTADVAFTPMGVHQETSAICFLTGRVAALCECERHKGAS